MGIKFISLTVISIGLMVMFIPMLVFSIQIAPVLLLTLLLSIPLCASISLRQLCGNIWDWLPVPEWLPKPKPSYITKAKNLFKSGNQDKILAA